MLELSHCGAKAERTSLACSSFVHRALKTSKLQLEGQGSCGIFFSNVFLLLEVSGKVEDLVSLVNVVFHNAIEDLGSLALDVYGFDLKLSTQ